MSALQRVHPTGIEATISAAVMHLDPPEDPSTLERDYPAVFAALFAIWTDILVADYRSRHGARGVNVTTTPRAA